MRRSSDIAHRQRRWISSFQLLWISSLVLHVSQIQSFTAPALSNKNMRVSLINKKVPSSNNKMSSALCFVSHRSLTSADDTISGCHRSSHQNNQRTPFNRQILSLSAEKTTRLYSSPSEDEDEENFEDDEFVDDEEEDDDDDFEFEDEDEEDDDDDDENEIVSEEDDSQQSMVTDDIFLQQEYVGNVDIEYEEEEEEEEEEAVTRGNTFVPIDDEDWDDTNYELEDDPDDADYQKTKELLESSLSNTEMSPTASEGFLLEQQNIDKLKGDDGKIDNIENIFMTTDDSVDKIKKERENDEEVDEDATVVKAAGAGDDNALQYFLSQMSAGATVDAASKEGDDSVNEGITSDDIDKLNKAIDTNLRNAERLKDPSVYYNRFTAKHMNFDWESFDNQTHEEFYECLDEIGTSSYNCTNWLLYDLDYNVTNLVLAAMKHNPNAPILFQHWYPQLITYSRYKEVRDGGFDWTWDDIESADIEELKDWYAGFGYDEIPDKAPAETGIISLEELDEEEIKMAAFETWMTDVYNPEWDRYDFDDDAFRDEDNVFSPYFEPKEHPDLPSWDDVQADLNDWDEEMGKDEDLDEDTKAYKHKMGRNIKYEVVDDEEFNKSFRGHLIVACTGDDADLEVAEKITARMAEAHGKSVFVETRVMAHAREDDNVFEIWLESYDVDLLHSKRRASRGDKDWDGPAECDAKHIEHLVDRVGFLISDDSRYSYRLFDESLQY